MRVFRRIAALAALAMAIAGCAGPSERDGLLDELSPEPMPAAVWAGVKGTYAGPIRATTEKFGFEDQASIEMRLDLTGWPEAPGVVLRMDRGYSTAWTYYGEWRGTFTNLPDRRYGTQGSVLASTHAPNQLLIKLRKNGATPEEGVWMILTFEGDGKVDANWIGRAGWHGNGELWKVRAVMNPQ